MTGTFESSLYVFTKFKVLCFSPLNPLTSFAQIEGNLNSGLISSDSDVDYFRIHAGMGDLNLEIKPTTTTPGNLDIKAELIQSNGQVIATEITNHYDLDDGVQLNTTLPGNGTYYLKLTFSNNGNEILDYPYNQSLLSNGTDTVFIDLQPESGINQIVVMAQSVNGLPDENNFNNITSATYNIYIGESYTFEIDQPFASSNMFWSIQEPGGAEIINSSAVDTAHFNNRIVQELCLSANVCFDFTIEYPFEANSCSGYPMFDENLIYNPSERFIYNNKLYEPNVIVHSISDPSAWPQYITEIDQCGSLTGNESFQLTSESSVVFQVNSQEAGDLFNTNFCSDMITSTTIIELEEIEVFPNPTDGKVNFNTNFDKLELFDAQGHLLQVINNHNAIDISKYPSGIYFAKVILTGRSFYKQLVRQ